MISGIPLPAASGSTNATRKEATPINKKFELKKKWMIIIKKLEYFDVFSKQSKK